MSLVSEADDGVRLKDGDGRVDGSRVKPGLRGKRRSCALFLVLRQCMIIIIDAKRPSGRSEEER